MQFVTVLCLTIASIFAYTLAAPQSDTEALLAALSSLANELAKRQNSTLRFDKAGVVITGIANANATANIEGPNAHWNLSNSHHGHHGSHGHPGHHGPYGSGWNYGWNYPKWGGIWRANPEEEQDIDGDEDDLESLEQLEEYPEDIEDIYDGENLEDLKEDKIEN